MSEGRASRPGSGDGAEALAAGAAFADLSFWRKVSVSGPDASEWLNDIVSADLSELTPGRAKRSLLLSPTGRIRAEFMVAARHDGRVLLLQDPMQPGSIDGLLRPYVLSSDVVLQEQTEQFSLFAFPGLADPPPVPGTAPSAPSCLGAGGLDLLAHATDHSIVLGELDRVFVRAGNEDVERWRVEAGLPRVGVDVIDDDLPEEGGLHGAVAFDKGCYLGQEAVARVRNLGHPRRLVLALEADEPVSPGEPLEAAGADGPRAGTDAGQVTSAAEIGGRTVLLARIRWDVRDAALRTVGGTPLRRRGVG